MSPVYYNYINCKGGSTPRKSPFGDGTVTVRNAVLNSTSEFGCARTTKITVTGGAHIMFRVMMGAHNYVVPPDQLNRRYNKPEDSGKFFEVDISGNICTYAAYVYSNQEYSGSFMHDASHLNLHLRGTWSMRDTQLWGNLGFDLETANEITLNNLMKRPDDESPVYLLADGYPEKVPEVIFNDVQPDYSLWQLVACLGAERDVVEKVYCHTLKAAQQVLESGCTINQFCAFKDAHYRPSCRCALYYPLLLELNPLALMYFLDAGVHTKQYVSELYNSIPRAQVEDTLNTAISKRPVKLTHTEYGTEIFDAPAEAKAVRRVTRARFDKFLKEAGVEKASLLWRAP